ncbi:hypothetical protein HYH03_002254 [Edaphochlamys debaryana]|uniref:RNA helicase n=1 Tax=Edaphochlamys debaryana TaxID=47281 RepID=A0A835YLN3_9CHLO|nr:hypothetical protein HYH03_002254 [Edaphochlamys debaryana]|eukprot:KAG2499969.1 hypothetical protein HYH03_002254 [Edaphochlamys debaryana]
MHILARSFTVALLLSCWPRTGVGNAITIALLRGLPKGGRQDKAGQLPYERWSAHNESAVRDWLLDRAIYVFGDKHVSTVWPQAEACGVWYSAEANTIVITHSNQYWLLEALGGSCWRRRRGSSSHAASGACFKPLDRQFDVMTRIPEVWAKSVVVAAVPNPYARAARAYLHVTRSWGTQSGRCQPIPFADFARDPAALPLQGAVFRGCEAKGGEGPAFKQRHGGHGIKGGKAKEAGEGGAGGEGEEDPQDEGLLLHRHLALLEPLSACLATEGGGWAVDFLVRADEEHVLDDLRAAVAAINKRRRQLQRQQPEEGEEEEGDEEHHDGHKQAQGPYLEAGQAQTGRKLTAGARGGGADGEVPARSGGQGSSQEGGGSRVVPDEGVWARHNATLPSVEDALALYEACGPKCVAGIAEFYSADLELLGLEEWLKARPNEYIVAGKYVLVLAAIKEGLDLEPEDFLAQCAVATMRCRICNVETTSAVNMRSHLTSERHAAALVQATVDDIQQAVAEAKQDHPGFHVCELCGVWLADQPAIDVHMRSNRHMIRYCYLLARAANLHLASPRNVLISQLPEPLPAVPPGEQASYTITLTNLAEDEGEVTLHGVRLLQAVDGVSLHDTRGVTDGRPVVLPYGSSYAVELRLAPRFLGLMRGAVRTVSASCATPEMEAEAQAAAAGAGERKRRRRRLEPVNEDVVRGEAPAGAEASGRRRGLERPVGFHKVPGFLRQAVEQCAWKGLEERLAGGGGKPAEATSVRAYAERLKLLLWLEELQHEVDVRQYDMEGETVSRAGRLFALQVPGLAENRPSVLKGDRILLRPSGDAGRREWEGVVHVVERERVLLGFHPSFAEDRIWIDGKRFRVRFSVNRSVFNRLQAMLERTVAGDLNPLLLLPGSPAAPLPRALPQDLPPPPAAQDSFADPGPGAGQRIVWSPGPSLNPHQRLAVREAVRGAHHPLPYIIFGPPGTGKTSTLVEVAVQLLKADPSAALLLVAPSNSAADQLMERLLRAGRPRSELLRVCAYTRDPSDLPPALADLKGSRHLNWDDDVGAFALPPKARLQEKGLRAIAATCATAAMLYHAGLAPGRFSHVLIDEAGHAEEPLALAALAGLVGPDTRVVMAGDPRQLGPVILSPIAKRHGLDVSLLERLEGREPYARRQAPAPGEAPYRTAYITKLLDNYRSHPDILAVPNAAFYDGELAAAAAWEEVTSLLHWEGLPNNAVPILFHHIIGIDDRELRSPSWYNLAEINQVKTYVESLMALCRNRLTGADIGVISPYRKQVQRIRAVLQPIASTIKVGSVEEFQGQERRVIIISTVRSNGDYLALDSKHRLGFLSNPKRFNVAITRAKALLIVVGNAEVLACDPHWRRLLRFLAPKGAITGPALPHGLLEPREDEAGAEAGAVAGEAEAAGVGGGPAAAEAADLAAQLQRLVLSSAETYGNGTAGVAREEEAELHEEMWHMGGALEAEGGEMRRME